MDFPFGQPRSLVAALGWPEDWEGYVGKVGGLSKDEFEDAIRADMATRPPGSKWRYRLADRRSHSSSAMMLFRVPVGKMFYQGAPRLLASGVRVEPCRRNGDDRVAVEAYPAVVARRFLGRTAYKRDAVPDTPERRSARETLLAGLESDDPASKSMASPWRWMTTGEKSSSETLPPTPSTRCCARSRRRGLT